jgi:hypothetical protein
VALADIDGDGDLDAVVANLFGQAETVWLADGTGTFAAHPTTPSFGTGHSQGVALGDLDGDGDLDTVVANYGQPQTVWRNDGTGSLSAHPTTPAFGNGGFGTALGDLDGDGDLDAVVSTDQLPQTVWLNDGTGSFSTHPSTPSFDDGSTFRTALGDLDGDGDLDAVVTHSAGGAETAWLNNGTGSFSAHPTTPSFGAGDSRDAALGDLDGDGDLDAIISNFSGQPETAWLNDGTGGFSAHAATPAFGDGDSLDAALADMDGDGDIDAFVANFSGQPETVWLNDGTGSFSAHPLAPGFGAGDSRAVALGDLDGDGDPDAVVANPDAETVWLNDGTDTGTDPPQVLQQACALKSNGLLRAGTDGCNPKSERLVAFTASAPVAICAQPDGSVRQIPMRSCKKPGVVFTVPASAPTYFCADAATGVLRYVTEPSDCLGSESAYVV